MFDLLTGLFARAPRANEVIRPKSPGLVRGFVHSGSTFSAGRNAEKRKARAAERELRPQIMAIDPHARMPKQHLSRLTVDMLANRRLRQRGVARG